MALPLGRRSFELASSVAAIVCGAWRGQGGCRQVTGRGGMSVR